MWIRIALAAGAVVSLAACATQPPAPSASTASVTVDGKEKKFNQVKCTQVEWLRTIDIGGDFSGAKVLLDGRHEPVTAQSVRIQNVGGFTGMYSQGDGSDAAQTSFSGGKFKISGTAHGSKADKPNEPETATFKVAGTC